MALSWLSDKNALQPRYRRLLDVGALLDESIRLFRQHWRTFAAVSAIALVPLGLLSLVVALAFASAATPNVQRRHTVQLLSVPASQLIIGAVGLGILFGLLSAADSMLWTAAVTRTTDAFMRDEQPTIGGAYGTAFRRVLSLLGGGILLFLGTMLLTVVGTALFIVTVFGSLGSLIALVALLVWWTRPTSRKPWLKWLIILTAPFGLPVYYAVRWSMFAPAAVLEGLGPLQSLRRSHALVQGEWFRAAGVLGVASLIVGVLVSAPTYLVNIPLTIANASRGVQTQDATSTIVVEAVSVICQVLFASIGTIAYTLLFTDLRNRREGADLAERVAQLEAPPA